MDLFSPVLSGHRILVCFLFENKKPSEGKCLCQNSSKIYNPNLIVYTFHLLLSDNLNLSSFTIKEYTNSLETSQICSC